MKERYCTVRIKQETTNEMNNIKVFNDENKKIFYYIEPDKTTTTYDYINDILKRENDSIILKYQFKEGEKTKNSIYIKELKNTIEIEIFTKKIEKKNKYLKIEYLIEDNEFTYEVIDEEQ